MSFASNFDYSKKQDLYNTITDEQVERFYPGALSRGERFANTKRCEILGHQLCNKNNIYQVFYGEKKFHTMAATKEQQTAGIDYIYNGAHFVDEKVQLGNYEGFVVFELYQYGKKSQENKKNTEFLYIDINLVTDSTTFISIPREVVYDFVLPYYNGGTGKYPVNVSNNGTAQYIRVPLQDLLLIPGIKIFKV